MGLLAPHDLVERRAGEEDAAVFEQAGDVAVEERQQERGDVVAVAVGSTLRPTSATCSTGSARIRRGGSRNCCPIAGRRYATPARPRRTDRLPSPGFFAVTTEEFGAFACAEAGISKKP